ncbi:neprilysin-2-like [Musca autumnalis]|uniref:neprilysin-2-like n=1 Tax=Musca autumnalis TaxID=221902 RepID=UPI003CEBABEC
MNYQPASGFVAGNIGGGGGGGIAAGGNGVGGGAVNIGGGLSHVQTVTDRRYTGGEMLKFLKPEQDPCEDFYEYACGNWLQVQNITDGQEGDLITLASILEKRVMHQLQRRLDDPSRNPHPVVNKFYRSCLATTWNEEKLFIKRFVAMYGGLPDIKDTWRERAYQWVDILARLKLDFNLDILIVFSTAANGRPVVKEPLTTIMPAELCNAEAAPQIDEQDEIFETIQMEIKEKLQLWFDFAEADATRLAGDIQRFEFDLCKFMRKGDIMELGKEEEEEVVVEPQETLTNYGGGGGLLHNKPPRRQGRSPPPPPHLRAQQNSIELEANQKLINFVQLCMGQVQGHGRTDFEITSPEYMQYLTSISGRKPSFANYIIYRALSELSLPQVERKPYCVRKVTQMFPEYMGNLYQISVPAQIREFVKYDVASIFRDIKEAIPRHLRKHIEALQISEPLYQGGIDPNTYAGIKTNGHYWDILKSITQNNVQQQQAMSAPPQRGGRQPQVATPNIVEAFGTQLASNEKTLQYGWGLLQPPFYSYNYPKSLKYSSLGFAIARELIKRHIDEQLENNKLHPAAAYSSHLDFNEFLSQRECFRSQVSSYFFNTPEVYRNATQLREIMADFTALSVAFTAYNNWLDKQDAANPDLKFETLPKMNFSNTQLFFINFAQTRCAARYSKEPPGEPSQCCPLDLHTIERLGINGPVSNDEEFGLDFNCPIGADMNAADKCSIIGSDFRRGF